MDRLSAGFIFRYVFIFKFPKWRWSGVWMVAAVLLLFSPLQAQERLRLATTTSTDNSGLLEALLPPFEKLVGVKVDVIAVGTGKALKLAEGGDVDLVIVHAPMVEEKFTAAGFGVNRRVFMHNDFVIVGAEDDRAAIKGSNSVTVALAKIAAGGFDFVSRGDLSGTHMKEKILWEEVGIEPRGKWYLETGLPMGQVLILSDQKKAYTLTDRGTFIALRDKLDLKILYAGDQILHNQYSAIAVNPARHREIRYMKAMALIAWVTSPEGQEIIDSYRKHGEKLFYPDAVPQR